MRLERSRSFDVPERDELFQFHKGAIRTVSSAALNYANESFQFHKGAIRTMSILLPRLRHIYFNSIKVRLEQS